MKLGDPDPGRMEVEPPTALHLGAAGSMVDCGRIIFESIAHLDVQFSSSLVYDSFICALG